MSVRLVLRAIGWFAVGLTAGLLGFFLLRGQPRVTVLHPPGAHRPAALHRVALHRYPLQALSPGARLPEGEPLLVNLWAPWCRPCLEEWTPLQNLAGRLRARGAATLGLAVATNARAARSFLHRHPSRYPIYLLRSHLRRLTRNLGIPVDGVPDTVLISPGGRVLLVVNGRLDPNDAKKILDVLVNWEQKNHFHQGKIWTKSS